MLQVGSSSTKSRVCEMRKEWEESDRISALHYISVFAIFSRDTEMKGEEKHPRELKANRWQILQWPLWTSNGPSAETDQPSERANKWTVAKTSL